MDKALAANDSRTTGESPIPTLIAGKYRVVRVLGEGSSGIVYLCEHTALEKQVAVKVLHRELADNADLVTRFKHEAQTAARLDHANSVHVMDFGQDGAGTLYLAMEYVEGRDLAELLDDQLRLDDERIVHIMTCVLSALSAAHALGIVHRDLKPENILFRYADDETPGTDIVKVCDFGVAQFSPIRVARPSVQRDGSSARRVTGDGMLVGTPWYMSPEQARAEGLDARSDIYSAGVVLFQLLTRTLPFVGDDAMAVAVMHCTTPPPPPSGYGSVHPGLEAVCLKALSKTREARYQSALEMLNALHAAVETRSPSRSLARHSRPSDTSADKLARLPVPAQAANAMTELATPVVRLSQGIRKLKPSLVAAGLALGALAAAALPHLVPGSDVPQTSVNAASMLPSTEPEPQAAPSDTARAAVAVPTNQAAPGGEVQEAIEDDPELELNEPGSAHPSSSARPQQDARVESAHSDDTDRGQASAPTPSATTRTNRRHSDRHAARTEPRKSDGTEGTSNTTTSHEVATAKPAGPDGSEPVARGSAAAQLAAPAAKLAELASDSPEANDTSASDDRVVATGNSATEATTPAQGTTSPRAPQTANPAAAIGAATDTAAGAAATKRPSATATSSARTAAATSTSTTTRSAADVDVAAPAPTKPQPTARISGVTIVAERLPSGISRSSLRSAFNQSSLTHCYQQAQRRQPYTPLPSAPLSIITNMSGRIVAAHIEDSVLPAVLRECLEQVARTGRIRNGDGGEVHTTVEVQPAR